MTTARPLRKGTAPSRAEGGVPLMARVEHPVGAAPSVREIIDGLSASQAFVSPKFLYDPLGSRLFAAITELPEYYPTRTEIALLEQHIGSIARSTGEDSTVIELGAGNCEKASKLFGALRPAQYVAVDISVQILEAELSALRRSHPEVQMIVNSARRCESRQNPPM